MSLSAETIFTKSDPSSSARSKSRASAAQNVRVEQVDGDVWDAKVAGFTGACQEQLFTFAKNRWPGVKCEPLLFYTGKKLVGGALVMIQPLPFRLGAIAVCKWGPILKDGTDPDADRIYASMVEALVAEYDGAQKLMLSVLPRAARQAENAEFDYLIARGFRKSYQIASPDRYVVKLGLSDEEQRKSFAQKWRYHLNKSMKADLSFEHAGAERLDEFDALYKSMTGRKQFADHSAYTDTVPALMAMDEALRPELFFVRSEGELVAGAVIFKAGETAVYLYGATNSAALPLRAGYFLHWNIIRWLRDNTSADWYDLGGTEGHQGLHQFKKGMVGDEGVIEPVPPVANYTSHFWPYLTGTLAFGAREGVTQLRRLLETMRTKVQQLGKRAN